MSHFKLTPVTQVKTGDRVAVGDDLCFLVESISEEGNKLTFISSSGLHYYDKHESVNVIPAEFTFSESIEL